MCSAVVWCLPWSAVPWFTFERMGLSVNRNSNKTEIPMAIRGCAVTMKVKPREELYCGPRVDCHTAGSECNTMLPSLRSHVLLGRSSAVVVVAWLSWVAVGSCGLDRLRSPTLLKVWSGCSLSRDVCCLSGLL